MNETAGPAGRGNERPAEHQLPPGFLAVLCAALAGGLPAGICITLVSEPGRQGSPIYGLLLPWGVLPFFLAIVSGWRGRRSPHIGRLAFFVVLAAVLGIVAHGYAFFFRPAVSDARKWFLFVPLWQWAVVAMPALRCLLNPGPPATPADPADTP